MRIPPFFIGATVLLWGHEKNSIVLGLVVAVLLEACFFTKKRWQLRVDDFVKISDLTSIILLAAVVLVLLNYQAQHFLIIIAGWLPLILLPLAMAQLYGAGEKISISTRLGSKKSKVYMHKPFDFRYFYLVVTVFAAAICNSRHQVFFPLLLILAAWVFWVNRGQFFSKITFSLVFVFAIILCAGTIKALEFGHVYVEQRAMAFWEEYFLAQRGVDPFKTNTSFGDVGQLKMSNKIIMRLESTITPPSLLKEASYTIFSGSSWFNRDQEFTEIPYRQNEQWQLVAETSPDGQTIYIEKYFSRNKGLLPYVYGSEQIRGLSVESLSQNREGLLRIEDADVLQKYNITYSLSRLSTTLPSDHTVRIPKKEQPALQQIVQELDLVGLSEQDKVNQISLFFRNDFSYSLNIKGKGEYNTPLGNFLLHTKVGYCELFATATALLLREAGVPSRYVTGYAIQEKSFLEQKYIIRSRHAHAWAEAYVDGGWLVLDTTPSRWLTEDESNVSFFAPVRDFFSFIKHQFNLFRIRDRQGQNLPLAIIVMIMIAFLVFKIWRRLNTKRKNNSHGQTKKIFYYEDSPFVKIEQELLSKGPRPRKNEPFLNWLQRIKSARNIDMKPLLVLYHQHQKLRFDPQGLAKQEKELLVKGVDQWLTENKMTL